MVNKPYVEKIMSDSCFTLKLSLGANFCENLIGSHKTKNHPKIYTKCVLQFTKITKNLLFAVVDELIESAVK